MRTAGISEATYYKWRKLYGGMGKSQLRELKAMEKENARLKRIVAAFVAISGIIFNQVLLKRHLHEQLTGCPILKGNGTRDPVVLNILTNEIWCPLRIQRSFV